jgi:hypothetical protein
LGIVDAGYRGLGSVEDGQKGSDGEEKTHCRDPARRRRKVRGRADSGRAIKRGRGNLLP